MVPIINIWVGEGGIVIMVGKLTKILQVPLDSASCTKPPPEFIGYLEVVDVHTHTHTHIALI